MPLSTVRFTVRFVGNVQGVGFRMTCLSEAAGLNVHGHVSNQSDGSVLMDIDASNADGKELIRRIKLARRGYIDDTLETKSETQNRSGGFRIGG